MENLSIKNNPAAEGVVGSPASRGTDTSLEKLADTFRQLVTTTGTTFDSGQSSLSQQASMSGITKASDAVQSIDHYRSTSDQNNGHDTNSRVADRDNSHNDVRQRDPRDDQAPRHDDARDTQTRDTRDTSPSDHRDGISANTHDDHAAQSRDTDQGESSPQSDRNSEQNSAQAENTDDANQKPDADETGAETTNAAATASGTANSQQTATANGTAGMDAASALAGAAGSAHTSNSNDIKQTVEAAKVAHLGTVAAKSVGAATANDVGLATAAKGATNKSDTANTHTGPQANAANTGIQAQGIAKLLNSNDKMQVNITVNSDAETLTSKPGSSLTAATVLTAADGKGNNQAAQNSTNGQAASGQNPSVAAVAQNAQAAQNQNQGQQNNQSQGPIQAAVGGKATSAVAQTIQGGSSVNAGGAEAASGATGPAGLPGSSQPTQQAQQSKAADTQNLNNQAPKGGSVVDQVSVKISKALQAGNDRISIQLKPAELGRVDVKMELTHDGRVMAVVTADNKDTLDLLRRDAGDLQKALEDAGLKMDSSDLAFDLRGGESETPDESESGASGNETVDALPDDIEDVILAHDTDVISDSRVDVRA